MVQSKEIQTAKMDTSVTEFVSPTLEAQKKDIIMNKKGSICRRCLVGSFLALLVMFGIFSCLFGLYWQKFIVGGMAN